MPSGLSSKIKNIPKDINELGMVVGSSGCNTFRWTAEDGIVALLPPEGKAAMPWE